ncbi:hypothetical protein J6S37_00495 [Candidatus Saccharibacteria bacterium]|nr:hypothetical protein [Candidatus Saccharibacteria bacterium]
MEVRNDDYYRIVEYAGKWLAERLKSPGVWKVLGEFHTKEEAEQAIEKDKEVSVDEIF